MRGNSAPELDFYLPLYNRNFTTLVRVFNAQRILRVVPTSSDLEIVLRLALHSQDFLAPAGVFNVGNAWTNLSQS